MRDFSAHGDVTNIGYSCLLPEMDIFLASDGDLVTADEGYGIEVSSDEEFSYTEKVASPWEAYDNKYVRIVSLY